MLRSVKVTAVALVVGLVAAACGSTGDEDPGEVAAEAQFDVVPYNRDDVLGEEELAVSSLLGQGTPVVLNFFAANCPPCLAEMPWLQAAADRHDGDVLLVGVDVGPFTGLGSNEEGAQLLVDLEITYPAAYAVDSTPVREVPVVAMPTTAFFDADGQLVDTHAGIMTEDQIEDRFQQLAEASP
jgi:thiol-disulfide isomerase/thioredoxin